jgi:hypothetical protein
VQGQGFLSIIVQEYGSLDFSQKTHYNVLQLAIRIARVIGGSRSN